MTQEELLKLIQQALDADPNALKKWDALLGKPSDLPDESQLFDPVAPIKLSASQCDCIIKELYASASLDKQQNKRRYAMALTLLGEMEQYTGKKDAAAAIRQYDEAIHLGSSRAMHNRAYMHQEGIDGPVDQDKAGSLYFQAYRTGEGPVYKRMQSRQVDAFNFIHAGKSILYNFFYYVLATPISFVLRAIPGLLASIFIAVILLPINAIPIAGQYFYIIALYLCASPIGKIFDACFKAPNLLAAPPGLQKEIPLGLRKSDLLALLSADKTAEAEALYKKNRSSAFNKMLYREAMDQLEQEPDKAWTVKLIQFLIKQGHPQKTLLQAKLDLTQAKGKEALKIQQKLNVLHEDIKILTKIISMQPPLNFINDVIKKLIRDLSKPKFAMRFLFLTAILGPLIILAFPFYAKTIQQSSLETELLSLVEGGQPLAEIMNDPEYLKRIKQQEGLYDLLSPPKNPEQVGSHQKVRQKLQGSIPVEKVSSNTLVKASAPFVESSPKISMSASNFFKTEKEAKSSADKEVQPNCSASERSNVAR